VRTPGVSKVFAPEFSIMSTKHEFNMEMPCEGCSNAAKRVLSKINETNVVADLAAQKVWVVSDKSSDELLQVLQKTGKKVSYVGTSN